MDHALNGLPVPRIRLETNMLRLQASDIYLTWHYLKFTAPLTGITAAVVGVIINIAVFFAYHVLWPQGLEAGFEANFEWFAAIIGTLAFIALFRFKVGIVTVIASSAAIGLVYSLLL